MGMPNKLNANGCYKFLNSLTAADHTRLIAFELDAFYAAASKSKKFHKWAALVLWSVFRGSDQYEWLHSTDNVKNTPENKNKFSFVMPAKDMEAIDLQFLRNMITVCKQRVRAYWCFLLIACLLSSAASQAAGKHNLTYTSTDSDGKNQGCRKVSFFMNLVLEGRLKRTRGIMKKWQAGRFAMKIIGGLANLAGSATPIPGVGGATAAVVGMVSGLVDTLADEAQARHHAKTVVLDTFINMVNGILMAADDDASESSSSSSGSGRS